MSTQNDDSKVRINELESELKSITVRYQLIKNELIVVLFLYKKINKKGIDSL